MLTELKLIGELAILIDKLTDKVQQLAEILVKHEERIRKLEGDTDD